MPRLGLTNRDIDMNDYKVKLSLPVTYEFLCDILTTAAEGGIGYWASYSPERDKDLNVWLIRNITDDDDELLGKGFVELKDITRALSKICSGDSDLWSTQVAYIMRCVMDPDGGATLDADDCDAILQTALFDEVIYG